MTSDLQQNKNQSIEVMLLISGGHQCEISLEPDAPLLRELFEALKNRSQNNEEPKKLIQIPLEEGSSSLYLNSQSIVAIATEPPVKFTDGEISIAHPPAQSVSEPQTEPVPAIQQPVSISPPPQTVSQPEPASVAQSQPQRPSKTFIESRYLQLDNFLSSEEHQRLLNYVFEQESAFVPSGVSSGDKTFRQSMNLYNFGEFYYLMQHRVRETIPKVLKELNIPQFEISSIETELTAHNDGHFYKIHNDNGDDKTFTRAISYVYYFNREPKAYTGGQLRIYNSWKITDYYYTADETFQTVEPRNNSIVFFSSSYCHEVMPVICPSKNFRDSRFTVNGWVRY